MTVSELPLADATPDAPDAGLHAGALARVRASIANTLGDVKRAGDVLRVVSVVSADLRRWWLIAARPPSMRAWLRSWGLANTRTPDGSGPLRAAWKLDQAVTGSVLFAASTGLLLAAGLLRWLAIHPARRWTAAILTGAALAWVALS